MRAKCTRQSCHDAPWNVFRAGASIVVGTDGALELACLTGATLHVVNAHKVTTAYQLAAASEINIPADDIVASNEAIHSEGQRVCDKVVQRADRVGVHAEAHCLGGDAVDALLNVAEDTQCDLLVVGNRGTTGARRFMLGSVPNKLSHHSPSSLLIVDTTTARK